MSAFTWPRNSAMSLLISPLISAMSLLRSPLRSAISTPSADMPVLSSDTSVFRIAMSASMWRMSERIPATPSKASMRRSSNVAGCGVIGFSVSRIREILGALSLAADARQYGICPRCACDFSPITACEAEGIGTIRAPAAILQVTSHCLAGYPRILTK